MWFPGLPQNGGAIRQQLKEHTMPKQKTKRAATKRFKKSATGKILRTCGGKSHLNACKTRKRKRNLRGMAAVSGAFQPVVAAQLATYNV